MAGGGVRQKCLATTRASRTYQLGNGSERSGQRLGIVVGRVDENEVERRLRGAGRLAKPGDGVGADDGRPVRLASPVRSRLRVIVADRAGVVLDERDVGGATGQRLDATGATPREKIEEPRAPADPAPGSRTASA